MATVEFMRAIEPPTTATLSELLDIDPEPAAILARYASDGFPPVAVVEAASALLKAVAEPEPDDRAPVNRSTTSPRTAPDAPGFPGGQEARDILMGYVLPWWRPLGSRYGRMAIPLMRQRDLLQVSPMDVAGLRAKPLATSAELTAVLRAAVATRAEWPARRPAFYVDLLNIFGYNAASALLQGGSARTAWEAGHTELLRTLQLAVYGVPELATDAVANMRSAEGASAEQVSGLLEGIDLQFSPQDCASYLEWSAASPKPGQHGYGYFQALAALAAQCGFCFGDLSQRMKTGLLQTAMNDHPPYSDRAAQLCDHWSQAAENNPSVSAMRGAIINRPIYLQELVPTTTATPTKLLTLATTDGGGGGGKTIDDGDKGNKRFGTRKTYNLWLVWAAAKRAGKPLPGEVPGLQPESQCQVCKNRGWTCVPFEPGTPEKRPVDAAAKRLCWIHGTWSCWNIEPFVNEICEACPDLKKEDVLRQVDNPGAVYRAGPPTDG